MKNPNRVQVLLTGLLVCAACQAGGCQNQKPAQHESTSPKAAAAPQQKSAASASAPAKHDVATAPVLVVWHTPYEGEPASVSRVEYAAWADGMVLFRRDFPKAPQTLMVGRVEAGDVQAALDQVDGQGFFRSTPFKFGDNGTVFMARSKGRANTMTAARPLAVIPEGQKDVSPPSLATSVPLWNTAVDAAMGLRETIDSDDLEGLVDRNGMYRGYDSKNPTATWWFSDAGSLWQTAAPSEKNSATTKPAR